MLKITAIGNLTADPSIRTNNATGATYAILRIASDRRYKDKDGNKLTDFVSIKVRSPLAERCAEFLKKSDKIAATGDFETIVTDGANTGFLIKANEIEFLTPRKKEESLEDILNADLSLPEGIEEMPDHRKYESRVDVLLAAGLPLTGFGLQKENFKNYLLRGQTERFLFEGRGYEITIQDVMLFPQGYTAILSNMHLIENEPSVIVCDMRGNCCPPFPRAALTRVPCPSFF